MIELTFSRSEREDIVLTEDDLFDFRFERDCFSGDTFELGGVSAKSIYMIIDNNTQRFPRGAFANSRVRLDIDGHFCGYFNSELPKRRNGVIELTVYDDMIKLDVEFPQDHWFPQTFWAVYAQCLIEAGIADHYSIVNGDIFVLNALFNNGVISHEYTDYIYANSCRNLVSGMAEWNGGFAYINDDGKLQVDVFSNEVSRTFYSGELMDFDYSDETVVFSKIKTSQKNKTYEMGDDSGYTLIINNQYIGYGLDDADFETYLGFIYDYYKGVSLTPMSFTLAEPDFDLKIGDRISVVDEEENVTVTGNISEISVSGNCSMTVTCGGFGNVSGVVNYNKTSTGQNNQTKAGAGAGVGKAAESDPTSEYFNDYEGNSVTGSYNHVEGKGNKTVGRFNHIEGKDNTEQSGATCNHMEGEGNELKGDHNYIGGKNNMLGFGTSNHMSGSGNSAINPSCSTIGGLENNISVMIRNSIVNGLRNIIKECYESIVLGSDNYVSQISGTVVSGSGNKGYGINGITAKDSAIFGTDNMINAANTRVFAFGHGLKVQTTNAGEIIVTLGKYNAETKYIGFQTSPNSNRVLFTIGNGTGDETRSNGLMIDEKGNIYCNRVFQIGDSNVSASDGTASGTVQLPLDSIIPAVRFIDHVPTIADLTGEQCVFIQCTEKLFNYGPTTIYKVDGIFAEKSVI